jgi:hypothetical protein
MDRNYTLCVFEKTNPTRESWGKKDTHPDGIVARAKAHFVFERPAGDAAVSLGAALRLCFAEPDCGAGHVAHRTQGEARYEVVRVDEGRDQILGKFAEARIPCGTRGKKKG